MHKRLRRHTFYIARILLLSFGMVLFIGYATISSNVETVSYDPFSQVKQIANNKTEEPELKAASPDATKELAKNKSKKEKPLTSTVINQGGSKTTIVSESTVSGDDVAKLNYFNSQPSNISSPQDVAFKDQVGSYASYESILKNYWQQKLLWTSTDIAQLREINIVDCSSCEWLGLYQGSYSQDSSGKIISAVGWISLNVSTIKNNPYILDYLKLTLSHEYGHHYSLYYKWTKLQLPFAVRFPDAYYTARSLPKESTAADYSKGWSNCDAEIVAEDYVYFYSGYGLHAMAGTYGYPGANVKNWLIGLPGSNLNEDNIAPTINITNPTQNANVLGTITVSANITDNIAVTGADFYIDDVLKQSFSNSPYSFNLDTNSVSNGAHTLKIIAFDSKQSTTATVTFNVNNNQNDSEAPTISITKPNSNPYQWTSGSLLITISATDNIGVVKTELYINDYLLATENSGTLRRYWQYFPDPGTYVLKGKAYDAAGNISEALLTVIKPE